MITYFIYARKSTESEDRQALSIESQINELKSLAEKDNLIIEKIFTESKSAKKSGRPVLNQMIKELKRNKSVSGILCWKLDRLTRNLLDGAIISDLLENNVIEEIRTPMQSYRNNSIDRLMSGIDMLFARKYIDDLSENVKRGMKTKVEMGWMPGRAPLGYLNKHNNNNINTIIPDPVRFKLLRKMWDLMLSGNYSVPQVLDIANNQWGFKTRKTRKMGDTPLSLSLLYKIFRDPFYCGQFKYQSELHIGKHKPMVTIQEFEFVKKRIERKGKAKPEKHISTFAGIFHCGICGTMITADNKIKLIKTTKTLKRFIYYRCTYFKRNNCPKIAIPEKELEHQIDNHLKAISLPKEYIDWIFKHYKSVQQRKVEKIKIEKSNIQKEIRSIEKKINNLMNLLLSQDNNGNKILSNEEYVIQKNRLFKEKEILKSSLKKYEVNNKSLIDLSNEIFDLCEYARFWFKNGDYIQKRTIINKIYRKHIIKNGKVQLIAKKPFELIANFRTENFGLGKTKNTSFKDVIPNWQGRLQEIHTAIWELAKENEDF